MSDALSLNEEQNIAVTHRDGHLLILAGAGTGKTRALVHRLGGLLNEGVAPEALLAITFTNKAAAEMRQRVIDMVGSAGEKVWLSTFHSAGVRMLRRDIQLLGYQRVAWNAALPPAWWWESKMSERSWGRHSSFWSTKKKSLLYEKRLINVFYCVIWFTDTN